MGSEGVVSWGSLPHRFRFKCAPPQVKCEEVHGAGQSAWVGLYVVSECYEAMSKRVPVPRATHVGGVLMVRAGRMSLENSIRRAGISHSRVGKVGARVAINSSTRFLSVAA